MFHNVQIEILDLGGSVKNEAKLESPIYKDPIEWIKYDLQVSKDGLAWLKPIVDEAKDDLKTYDILKAYYIDEEEDMYWAEQQLELIEKIGLQNWLANQLQKKIVVLNIKYHLFIIVQR